MEEILYYINMFAEFVSKFIEEVKNFLGSFNFGGGNTEGGENGGNTEG